MNFNLESAIFSAREHELLTLLAAKMPDVVWVDDLISAMYPGVSREAAHGCVKSTIGKLRAKLRKHRVVTHHGTGYALHVVSKMAASEGPPPSRPMIRKEATNELSVTMRLAPYYIERIIDDAAASGKSVPAFVGDLLRTHIDQTARSAA